MNKVRAYSSAVGLLWLALTPPASHSQPSPQFVLKWGILGSGPGEFYRPTGVAVDPDGNVYVADTYNNRIQKFANNGDFVTQWGSLGSGDGQLASPWGIAVDIAAYVYVADYDNHQIQKFTRDGVFLTRWGSWGSGDGQFDHPFDVAVDWDGQAIYVADRFNNRIQKFTNAGEFLTKWGTPGADLTGQLVQPSGVAVGPSGNVYVIDANYRIQKFTPDGEFISMWGSEGSGEGQFLGQDDLAVDRSERVYVADDGNNRVQEFSGDGSFLRDWGTTCRLYVDRAGCIGEGDGQFFTPRGVAIDSRGDIFVSEVNNHRVQKFSDSPVAARRATWGQLKTIYK